MWRGKGILDNETGLFGTGDAIVNASYSVL